MRAAETGHEAAPDPQRDTEMELIDHRTDDGSRQFCSLPKTCTWQTLCEHVLLLPGTQIVNFVAAGVAEAWIDFSHQGHRFLVSEQGGRFCFHVRDPQCPDLTLYRVASHCEQLLRGG